MIKRQILGFSTAFLLAPLIAFCGYQMIKPQTTTGMSVIVGISITLAILAAQLAVAWHKSKTDATGSRH